MKRFIQYRSLDFYEAPKGRLAASLPALPDEYELLQIGNEELAKCPLAQEKSRFEKFAERLKQGHICFGLKYRPDNQIIGYFWISLPPAKPPLLMGIEIGLRDGEAYIWDCRIHPDHQNKGLYRAGLGKLQDIYGQHALWINSESNNAASRKAIEKAGFTFQHNTLFITCLNRVLLYQNARLKFGPSNYIFS